MKNEIASMNLSASESGLEHLAKQGDAGAFAALFESHKTRVYSLCRQSALSGPDAEQLTQDIFLEAFRNLAASPTDQLGDTSFSAHLHSSAMNRIQMYERKVRLSAPFLDHLVKLAIEPVGGRRTVFSNERAQSRNNNNNHEDSSQSAWSYWSSLMARFVRPRQTAKALS